MPLLSLEFLLFFLCFFPLYWAVKRPHYQNLLLLVCGLAWLFSLSALFAFAVVLFSLVINLIAELMLRAETEGARRRYYGLGIGLTLANLAFFKYYDFFRAQVQAVWPSDWIDILLPLGISYYSFQAIAYLTSLLRQEPVKLAWHHLLLHFSCFLTITAGPIARVGAFKQGNEHYLGMKTQLETQEPRSIFIPHLAIGLILLGVAKKWWFAGALAENVVTPVFENPSQYDLFSLLAAVYGYTFQLFFDFSGYSDLVIGLAMLLGFQLPRNFNMPFVATNLKAFWQRWHISLSSWIRDYIYIPLGGNQKGFVRTQLYLALAMVLSGVWHGSGWNFFLWGLAHGLAFVVLNVMGHYVPGRLIADIPWIGKGLAILLTFHFVALTFVIFRTANLEETLLFYQALWHNEQGFDMHNLSAMLWLCGGVLVLAFYRYLAQAFDYFCYDLSQMPLVVWALAVVVLASVIVIFAPSGIPAFIYANF